jgi:NAD(P)-dependent dehydrogenase (short-subunit alcohol dehydrogenase family)
MQRLEGQTALVTGGAKRLGRSIVLALAEAGVNVVVHYRESQTEAETTATDAQKKGVKAVTLQADIAKPGTAIELYKRATAEAGTIDILVNNASLFRQAALADCSEEELQANIQLHATSPLQLSRCLAEAGRQGVIVNLLDTRIARHDPAYGAYCLSKRMLADQTTMLALELAPNIRVNGVAPGPILPPEGARDGLMAELAASVPLQAIGTADDIAEAALFLVRSNFITGQIIYVDGGSHIPRK